MATRFDHYTEALRFMREAAVAIDQAHACMKDAGLDDLEIKRARGGSPDWINVGALSNQVAGMLKELETADCPQCDHRIIKHADKGGCEYERGAVEIATLDGGTVMAGAGPCGCDWSK
jgi:hypothetical protein